VEAATIWGIILVVYALLVIALAVFKPAPVWRLGKIQAFVKLLGEKGTVIFFLIFAIIVLVIGIVLLV
jgi:hypothetical protein